MDRENSPGKAMEENLALTTATSSSTFEDSAAGPCSRYSREARAAASTLLNFSQRYTAKGLADIALDSASLVERAMSTMDENCRTVVTLLKQENEQLRTEIEKLVHRSAEAVASVLVPSREQGVSESGDAPTVGEWQPPICLTAQHDQVIQVLSETVKQLSEENDKLRAQVVEYQAHYVPKLVADEFRSQLAELDNALQTKKSELEAALVRLENDVSLSDSSVPSNTAHLNEESSRGAAQQSSMGVGVSRSSAFDSASCDPMWAEAIRELEERAVIAASQVRDRDYVEQLERDIGILEAKCSKFSDDADASRKLVDTIQHEYQVLQSQNDALMGQFVSLLQTTQQMATQYQLMTERASSGRSHGTPGKEAPLLSPSGALFAKPLDFDKKAMQSILDVQQYSQVLDASVAAPAPSANAGDFSKMTLRSAMGASPSPRQPYSSSSTYRRFTKEEIASSAEKYGGIQSIGDMVRKNQKLIGQTTEMELDLMQLRSKNEQLEQRVAVLAGQCDLRETRTSGTSAAAAKRNRTESSSIDLPRTADASTSTDSANELSFWFQCASQRTKTAVDEPPLHQRDRSQPPSTSSETLYWTLLNFLGETHTGLVKALGEQIEIISGEHSRTATDALVRSSVQYAARALRAENEAMVANCAYEEALGDLNVRDALAPHHLDAILQLAEQALCSRRSGPPQPVQDHPKSLTDEGSPDQPLTARDVSLWNSFTHLLQSATAKEQMLTQLIREAPVRSELSQAFTSPSDVKLNEAEAKVAELTTQLEHERSRATVLAETLHREKLRHVETLERMWEAEQKVVEAQEAEQMMRQSSGCMYTRDQYDQLRNELASAQTAVVEVQVARDTERESLERKLADQSDSLTAALRDIDNMQRAQASLQAELSNAQSTISTLQRNTKDAHREMQHAQSESRTAVERMFEEQRALGVSQRLVEELKQALLSQTCTEQLLFSLFPGESALQAVFSRSHDLNDENRQLKEGLASRDLQLVNLENQLASAQVQLSTAEDERQLALVECQLLQSSSSVQEHSASSELKRLTVEVEGLHHRVACLQREKEQLQQRERILEERVEILASDPISMNVRKYGVERTRTIEEQMEQLYQQTTALQAAVSSLESQRASLEQTVASVTANLELEAKKVDDLRLTVQELEQAKSERDAKIRDHMEAENSLNQTVRNLENEISETSRSLEGARREIIDAAATIKATGEAEQRATANGAKLLDDNLALIEQVKELTDVITRIEAEHRSTKVALATQTSALAAARASRPTAQASTSSRKSAPSFAEASMWRSK